MTAPHSPELFRHQNVAGCRPLSYRQYTFWNYLNWFYISKQFTQLCKRIQTYWAHDKPISRDRAASLGTLIAQQTTCKPHSKAGIFVTLTDTRPSNSELKIFDGNRIMTLVGQKVFIVILLQPECFLAGSFLARPNHPHKHMIVACSADHLKSRMVALYIFIHQPRNKMPRVLTKIFQRRHGFCRAVTAFSGSKLQQVAKTAATSKRIQLCFYLSAKVDRALWDQGRVFTECDAAYGLTEGKKYKPSSLLHYQTSKKPSINKGWKQEASKFSHHRDATMTKKTARTLSASINRFKPRTVPNLFYNIHSENDWYRKDARRKQQLVCTISAIHILFPRSENTKHFKCEFVSLSLRQRCKTFPRHEAYRKALIFFAEHSFSCC